MKMHTPPGETWLADYQIKHYNMALKHALDRTHAVDIGAHIGIWTQRYARDFERVTAIEPINSRYLEQNTQHLDNVTIYPVGLSNTPGTLYAHNPGTLTAHTELHSIKHTENARAVQVITLDSLKLTEVSLLKIDTQGLERQVLEGATHTIHTHKPLIHIETRSQELLKWIEHTYDYKRVDRYIKDWVLLPTQTADANR